MAARFVLAVALATTVVVGLFVGFSRCGGYGWHRSVAYAVVWLCVVGACAFAPRRLASRVGRTGIGLALLIAFELAEACGAALYPDTPASISEFIERAVDALADGSC